MKKHKTILFRVYKNITRYNQKNMSNPITKEEEDEQSPSVIEPSAGNPNMPLPPFQEQKKQALSEQQTQQPTTTEENSRSNPQQETTSQPIAATTAAGVTAPKPKVDFTATDATIQGLLIQAIALYHNKTQQQQQQE